MDDGLDKQMQTGNSMKFLDLLLRGIAEDRGNILF